MHRTYQSTRRIPLQIRVMTDCSQTLYEFRASNPKALNILEGSGVFETHKLQTNYRSNQEILDFANVVLGTIEANQYANIQLRANSLKPVTLQSFQDAVRFSYSRIPNRGKQTFDTTIAHTISIETRQYVQDLLAKGEQIAVLAYKHSILNSVKKHLQNMYPGKKIVEISPSRGNDSTLFSKFIAMFWDNISYTPPLNLLTTIRREIMANINALTAYRSQTVVQKTMAIATDMMDEIEKLYGTTVADWQRQVAMSVMTTEEMLNEVRKLLIGYEIKRNSAAQAVRSAKAAKAKEDLGINDADFILSTVHSAKGLEFDNVIVYYDNNPNDGEPEKRLYYVAFTRAKHSEFIVAFGEQARPKIQGDYERILKTLQAQQPAAAGQPGADNSDDVADGTVPGTDGVSVPEPPDVKPAPDGDGSPVFVGMDDTSGDSGTDGGEAPSGE